jgi:hypothetical protein
MTDGRLLPCVAAPIRARDLESALATSHLSDLVGVTQDYDPALLFTGNSTCVLADDTTEGPYCESYIPTTKAYGPCAYWV